MLAVQAFLRCGDPAKSEARLDELCRPCHRIYTLDDMAFGFEVCCVYPVNILKGGVVGAADGRDGDGAILAGGRLISMRILV